MDSYQGSTYDPVSLHKYLYANTNPVMYTDSSGYAASTNLTETTVAAAITVMLVSAVAFHDQAMMNIFANLRRNLASSAMLPECTNVIYLSRFLLKIRNLLFSTPNSKKY